jgi:MFS superfamily sulfate permease-like transporter
MVFLNAGRFRQQVISLASTNDQPFTTLTMDAGDLTMLDATAAAALAELDAELLSRNITFTTLGLAAEFDRRLQVSRTTRL